MGDRSQQIVECYHGWARYFNHDNRKILTKYFVAIHLFRGKKSEKICRDWISAITISNVWTHLLSPHVDKFLNPRKKGISMLFGKSCLVAHSFGSDFSICRWFRFGTASWQLHRHINLFLIRGFWFSFWLFWVGFGLQLAPGHLQTGQARNMVQDVPKINPHKPILKPFRCEFLVQAKN